jgi:predicted nucleic acid-binding protein
MTRAVQIDTSFLVRAFVPDTPESMRMAAWLAAGRPVAISAIAWTEFLCGPLGDVDRADAVQMLGEPLPFVARHAELAARLFNLTGRRRSSLSDCLVAAVAIDAEAPLATTDAGFARFAEAGLQIAD